jgi:hypothetical protein
MKKTELENGMIVELRNGERYLVDKKFSDRRIMELDILLYNDNLIYDNLLEDDPSKDIVKVFKIDIDTLTINLIWERKEQKIQLTQEQIKILKALKTLGYNWIARDANNRISGYSSKPYKNNFHWDFISTRNSPMDTLESGLDFIKWEDEEPTSIDDLLNIE